MVKLTFYGGVNEIGGNKILLETEEKAIFLDFGTSFKTSNLYYEPPFFNSWNTFDRVKIGALPPLDLYKEKFPNECKIKIHKKNIDGFFISHAHADHYGELDVLQKKHVVYAGEATELLIKIRKHQGGTNWDTAFACQWENFQIGKTTEIGDIQVIAYPVDHSVPAAYGFIIHAGQKTLVYTGDIRIHGTRKDLTEDFLKAISKEKKIEALICEGTRLSSDEDFDLKLFEEQYNQRFGKAPKRIKIRAKTEDDVKKEMTDLIRNAKGLVIIDTGVADIDRIRTIYKATKASGRKLLIQDKQAYLCFTLGNACTKLKGGYKSKSAITKFVDDLPGPKDVNVLFKRHLDAKTHDEDMGQYLWQKVHFKDYWDADCAWGERTCPKSTFGREDIREHPSEFVICTHYVLPVFQELYDGKFSDCSYIMSKSEPFSEEMVLSLTALNSWLLLLGIKEYHQLHVSGHCRREQLKEIIEQVNPEIILPIHTEHPEMFKELTKVETKTDLRQGDSVII